MHGPIHIIFDLELFNCGISPLIFCCTFHKHQWEMSHPFSTCHSEWMTWWLQRVKVMWTKCKSVSLLNIYFGWKLIKTRFVNTTKKIESIKLTKSSLLQNIADIQYVPSRHPSGITEKTHVLQSAQDCQNPPNQKMRRLSRHDKSPQLLCMNFFTNLYHPK